MEFVFDKIYRKGRGVWGQITRPNQGKPSSSCGSLVGALGKEFEALRMYDFLDMEQCRVETLLKPWLQNNPVLFGEQKNRGERVVRATKWVNE